MGPTVFNERDTTHFGWRRHAAANSWCSAFHSAWSSSQYRIISYITYIELGYPTTSFKQMAASGSKRTLP
jgi:hypothetical protein